MAMRDPSIPCDRVHFWNVAWDRRVQLTQVDDHICPGGAGSHVRALALGGVRAAWLVENPAGRRWLISATIVACEERVVAKAPVGDAGASARGLVGDGGLVAFSAIGAPGVQAIWRSSAGRSGVRGQALVPRTGSVAISADDDRVAALSCGGRIEIRNKFGALERRRASHRARGPWRCARAVSRCSPDAASTSTTSPPARARTAGARRPGHAAWTCSSASPPWPPGAGLRRRSSQRATRSSWPPRRVASRPRSRRPAWSTATTPARSGEFRFVPFAKVRRALAA